MPLTQFRATEDEILEALRDKVIDDVPLDRSVVFLLAKRQPDEVPNTMAKSCVSIRPGKRKFLEGQRGAAGRYDRRVEQQVMLKVWTRLASDRQDRDDAWLLEERDGNVVRKEALIDVLDGEFLEDSDGNHLTTRALWLVDEVEVQKSSKDGHWGHSALIFAVRYDRKYADEGFV